MRSWSSVVVLYFNVQICLSSEGPFKDQFDKGLQGSFKANMPVLAMSCRFWTCQGDQPKGPRGSSAEVVVGDSQVWGFDRRFYETIVALDRFYPPKWCTLQSLLRWLLPCPSQPGTRASSHPAVLSISGADPFLSPLWLTTLGSRRKVVRCWWIHEGLWMRHPEQCYIFLSCIP